MREICVVVADDHPLFRQGVVNTLSVEPDLRVVGEASHGQEALRLILAMQPDVAVVDINMPGLNGQQVTHQVVGARTRTRIILLTAYDDAEQIIHAFRAGAAAYCSKDIQPHKLAQVVREVASGAFVMQERVWKADELRHWLDEQMRGASRSFSDPGEPFYPLSEREMEVLAYLTQGLSNKEIAAILGISHQTVKNHVTAVLRKLGVDDRTQAAVYALRRGWVRLSQNKSSSQE